MIRKNVRGVNLALDLEGSGDELIVFIHGVGADRTAWASQHAFFNAAGYTTAAIDMRGSGDSDSRTPSGELLTISINEFALDVDALIRELGYDCAHWVGNSMGGVIIQEAMKLKLPTLAKAVLCNTFAKHPASSEILPRASAALRTRSLEVFAGERIPLVLRKDTTPEALEGAIHAMARKDPEAYLAAWRATWSPDYRDDLFAMKAGALVIGSTEDTITPPALSEELARGLPTAHLEIISAAGHISNMDQPEIFNKLVLDYLKA